MDIINTVADYANKNALKTEQLIEQIREHNRQYQRRLEEIKPKLVALEAALAKAGLTINELRIRQSLHHDTSIPQWSEGDCICWSISAAPVTGKFRFIKFRGYTARGASKNEAALLHKARTLEVELEQACGMRISVNSCSLEVRGEDTWKLVLIEGLQG